MAIESNDLRQMAWSASEEDVIILHDVADELDALRDRVAKLIALHEAAKKYWSIPPQYRCFPGKSATYIAAARAAGVEP